MAKELVTITGAQIQPGYRLKINNVVYLVMDVSQRSSGYILIRPLDGEIRNYAIGLNIRYQRLKRVSGRGAKRQ